MPRTTAPIPRHEQSAVPRRRLGRDACVVNGRGLRPPDPRPEAWASWPPAAIPHPSDLQPQLKHFIADGSRLVLARYKHDCGYIVLLTATAEIEASHMRALGNRNVA